MTRRPTMQDLSGSLSAAARAIAGPIARAGGRAWIVGGAPRDLALGLNPAEIDMASAATPAELEALFEHTIPVGRAFGTVIVRAGEIDVQHTTFRMDAGYSDARRPDAVAFGKSAEEDSARRDFTCNALYLDPMDDTFLDPQGGLEDLAAGRLRCVGDPEERFREDGLRLLRLARFAAALELEPDAETLAAARRCGDSLRGVSPERVLAELAAIFEKPGTVRALALLAQLDLLRRALPGLDDLTRGEGGLEAWWEARRRLLEKLPAVPGIALGLAALLGPSPARLEAAGGVGAGVGDGGGAVARALRPSRDLMQRMTAIWDVERGLRAALSGSRAARIGWMRSPAFDEGVALARSRSLAEGASADEIDAAAREREKLGQAGLWPAALITSEDLERVGVPKGRRWGEILREAETQQLDGRISTREAALAWLAESARRVHDGGKTPRNV